MKKFSIKKNKWLSGIVLLLCLVWAAGCGSSATRHNEAEEWDNKTLPELLQAWYEHKEDPGDKLKEAFFDYYAANGLYNEDYWHSYELRLLPEFAEGEQPDWEEASHWLTYFAAYDQELGGYRAEDMAAAARVLLADYEMPRKSSGWLNYDPAKDCFEPVGWDDHGTEFYVLQEIGGDGERYRARFLVFELEELWYDELYASTSANGAALLAYARENEGIEESENEITVSLNVSKAMKQLLLDNILADGSRNQPEPGMVSRASVEVSFRLSGDEELPFTYLSCQRWPEDRTLGEAFGADKTGD